MSFNLTKNWTRKYKVAGGSVRKRKTEINLRIDVGTGNMESNWSAKSVQKVTVVEQEDDSVLWFCRTRGRPWLN